MDGKNKKVTAPFRAITPNKELQDKILDNVYYGIDSCWYWLGSLGGDNYGRLQNNGKTIMAHRASYTVFNGLIPEGLLVCHHCDNTMCVNPYHLFVGTRSDNVNDMVKKGRQSRIYGMDKSTTRLTDDQIRDIRAMKGISYSKIANLFNTDRYYVYRIKHIKVRSKVI